MTNKFNDNFIFEVLEEEQDTISRLDNIDDTVWEVLQGLNELLEIGVDFDNIEHTPLSLEAREALVDVLESFK